MEFLNEYSIPMIVGICLCLGYMLKTLSNNNKYILKSIPTIMGIIGIIINIWINKDFTPSILLGGMFSGLSSTGLHQAFKQVIDKDK